MPYSVTRMIVDGNQNVAAIDWSYSNADGTISNTHVMQKPYGTTPLSLVTEQVSVEWLVEQLQNTTEEFDAAIANRKAQAAYEATLKPYAPHTDGPPTPITMPAPVPPEKPEVPEEKEPEPVAETKPAGRKAKK